MLIGDPMIYISLESLFHMQEPLRFLFLLFCVYVDYTNPYVYKIYVQLYIKIDKCIISPKQIW